MNPQQRDDFEKFLKTVGPIADFKPCAYFDGHDVVVKTKDCSYYEKWINPWLTLFYQNHRPWYAPWKKCVGFKVCYPSILKLSGTMSVTNVLDLVAQQVLPGHLFGGKYHKMVYRLAQGLKVQISVKES